jgi:hypothetical protein
MVLIPETSAIPEIDHAVVPVAVPLPPPLPAQATSVTAVLSDAVPLMLKDGELAIYEPEEVGRLILTTGAVVSVE